MSLTSGRQLLLSSAAATGYQVSRSLRFNSADSAYLSRVPSSTSTTTTWTWSAWVKRSTLGSKGLFGAYYGNLSRYFLLRFSSSDQIDIFGGDYSTSSTTTNVSLITTSVYRDTSAWMHIVFTYDTTNGTSSDRARLYVNNIRVTTFSTEVYPGSSSSTFVNYNTATHYLGAWWTGSEFFDGYLANVEFIAGTALTPSSFAETDATTGQWVPKQFSGSYGTNGFKLTFADNSNNTASTLGADTSSNGNNWTPNNLSVTAGAGNDSLTDTPTSYGSGTSGGDVRGNFCTWNPLGTAGPASSNGNLDIASSSTAGNKIGTFLLTSGKWYWECSGDGYAGAVVGVGGEGFTGSMSSSGSKAIGYWFGGGIYWDGGSFTSGIASYTTTDVIGVAVDMTAGTVAFYKNNTLVYTATFGSGTVPNLSSGVYPGFNTGNPGGSARTVIANFGQRAFAYTPPANFKPLVDTYLPTPTVAKPSTVMDVALWTGTGVGGRAVTGLSFNPDLVWLKRRSSGGANSHQLHDAVRGATTGALYSDLTNAEDSNFPITSFNSAGFTLGSSASLAAQSYASQNESSQTYVGWCFDAGSSAATTNNSGTIISTVKVNASSGFSVVGWTSNAASQIETLGHGLGVAPTFIIVKNRDVSDNWIIYHASLSNPTTSGLYFTPGAAWSSSPTTYWSTSSTTFGVRQSSIATANTQKCIAYCWTPVTGYTSMGSYVGDGSTSGFGPFIHCGFRPKFILIKGSTVAYSWLMFDSVRNPYNLTTQVLYADSSTSEMTNNGTGSGGYESIDILSNGFQIKSNSSRYNQSGATYIYFAVAESPFQYSRAR